MHVKWNAAVDSGIFTRDLQEKNSQLANVEVQSNIFSMQRYIVLRTSEPTSIPTHKPSAPVVYSWYAPTPKNSYFYPIITAVVILIACLIFIIWFCRRRVKEAKMNSKWSFYLEHGHMPDDAPSFEEESPNEPPPVDTQIPNKPLSKRRRQAMTAFAKRYELNPVDDTISKLIGSSGRLDGNSELLIQKVCVDTYQDIEKLRKDQEKLALEAAEKLNAESARPPMMSDMARGLSFHKLFINQDDDVETGTSEYFTFSLVNETSEIPSPAKSPAIARGVSYSEVSNRSSHGASILARAHSGFKQLDTSSRFQHIAPINSQSSNPKLVSDVSSPRMPDKLLTRLESRRSVSNICGDDVSTSDALNSFFDAPLQIGASANLGIGDIDAKDDIFDGQSIDNSVN